MENETQLLHCKVTFHRKDAETVGRVCQKASCLVYPQLSPKNYLDDVQIQSKHFSCSGEGKIARSNNYYKETAIINTNAIMRCISRTQKKQSLSNTLSNKSSLLISSCNSSSALQDTCSTIAYKFRTNNEFNETDKE